MRLLFFPSSSAAMGYGEIARCSIIAEECRRRYPGTEVLFLLDGRRSKKPMYDLPHSYFHGGKKAQDQRFEQLCESFRPDVAVFDCQLSWNRIRICRRRGVRIVNVANRNDPVRRAVRWHWLARADATFVMRHVTRWNRVSPAHRWFARILGPRKLTGIDTVMSPADSADADRLLREKNLHDSGFVLFIPGGGGGGRDGISADRTFLRAASAISADTTTPTLVVLGPGAAGHANGPYACHVTRALPNGTLAGLMSRARLVVSGGGATLVQSIVLGTPVVGVPLGAKDQPARIAGFEQLGAAIPAQCDPDAIRETVKGPLGDPETLRRLRANLSALETVNGLYPIVAAIGHALPNGPI